MIVVADSGLTKTDWRIVLPNKSIIFFETKGLSPFFSSSEDYSNALKSAFPSHLNPSEVSKIFFYGSGCAGDEKGALAQQALQKFFVNAESNAYSDILAAARALFEDGRGVIAILGTGSNIGYYDGIKVTHYTPSLGFILGDEGSGAYIGRQLIQSYFYGFLPAELSESLHNRHNLNLSDILDRIYCQQKPSTYLASFVPFVKENISNEYIYQMIYNVFEELYEFHLKRIPELKTYGLGVVGSVGFVFSDFLNKIAQDKGFQINRIIQYPIESLVNYHSQKEN
jgi:N-acetylglucosamine kinase-like BadF-type ATPase